MYDHHATHVITWITFLCVKAMKADNMDEARRLSKLVEDLEALFPDAAAEVAALSNPGDTHAG